MYPTLEEIEQLHRKYAPNERLFDLVFTHCKIVWDLAEQIIKTKALKINIPLVSAGALLHDIGTYPFMREYEQIGTSKYYQHALEGFTLLQKEGLPEKLCLLVLHHMRIGLTKEQVDYENLDLPLQDYSPTTQEERLVMYADKFHSKTPQFNSYESYKNFVVRFGDEQAVKLVKLANEFGIPDLKPLAAKYNQPIV